MRHNGVRDIRGERANGRLLLSSKQVAKAQAEREKALCSRHEGDAAAGWYKQIKDEQKVAEALAEEKLDDGCESQIQEQWKDRVPGMAWYTLLVSKWTKKLGREDIEARYRMAQKNSEGALGGMCWNETSGLGFAQVAETAQYCLSDPLNVVKAIDDHLRKVLDGTGLWIDVSSKIEEAEVARFSPELRKNLEKK